MTKEEVTDLTKDATEYFSIDIDDTLYAYYVEEAAKIGVPVGDYMSAVVIKWLKETIKEKNGTLS